MKNKLIKAEILKLAVRTVKTNSNSSFPNNNQTTKADNSKSHLQLHKTDASMFSLPYKNPNTKTNKHKQQNRISRLQQRYVNLNSNQTITNAITLVTTYSKHKLLLAQFHNNTTLLHTTFTLPQTTSLIQKNCRRSNVN